MKLPLAISGPIVRKKVALHALPLDRYEVDVAHTIEDHEQAFRLVHAAYVFQGIEVKIDDAPLRITPQHVLAESTIFLVREQGAPVATMTVTLDSPARLPLDEDYPEELAALRAEGAKIVEYGSLMVVRRSWKSGAAHLLTMAAQNFSVNLLEADHVVAGVHPRAIPLYAALYGFRPMGKVRRHSHLHAPVQGMVAEFGHIRRFMRKYHRRPLASGARPDEHFFDEPLPCVRLPPVSNLEELTRWKLPRQVFQEIFVRRSDRLRTLDHRTRTYLQAARSMRTLEVSV